MHNKLRYLSGAVLAAAFLASCGDRNEGPVSSTATELILEVVSGDKQTGAAGTELNEALVVRVAERNGGPRPQQVLSFRVIAGGGNISSGTKITDNEGMGQEQWTLGTRAGEPQMAEVRLLDATGQALVTDTFTATAVAGPPARMVVHAGNGQNGRSDMPVPVAPAVSLTDRYGNAVADVAVTFAVTSGGGSVTGANARSNSNGVATVGSWRLGPGAGAKRLRATAAGSGIEGNPVTFTATAASPACDCWSTRTLMLTRRSLLATVAISGKVYAVGGMQSNQNLTTLEVYDAATDSWTAKASMPFQLRRVAAASLNGILYVGGGGMFLDEPPPLLAYDPSTDTWAQKASMSHRELLGMAAINGILYAVGGTHPTSDEQGTVQAYDPSTDTWVTRAPMPTPRAGLGLVAVNGMLYAIGGSNHDGTVAAVEAYDPMTDTWSTKAPMPTPRSTFGIAVVDGIIYTVGGGPYGAELATVEAYDPATNTWSTKKPLPWPRARLAGAAVGGLVYAIGGEAGGADLSTVEAYQP